MYCAKNRNCNHTNNTEILAESKRTCIEYILRYLISELQPLVGRQRLLNLYFLVDVTGFKISGAVITPEITYKLCKNGVFSRDIFNTLYELIAEHKILEIQFANDFAYYAKKMELDVHDAINTVIDLTIQNYGTKSNTELTKIVKKEFDNITRIINNKNRM